MTLPPCVVTSHRGFSGIPRLAPAAHLWPQQCIAIRNIFEASVIKPGIFDRGSIQRHFVGAGPQNRLNVFNRAQSAAYGERNKNIVSATARTIRVTISLGDRRMR